MHVISGRQRLEQIQRRHAGHRKPVANLVRHLPAEFADDVANPSGVPRLDAVEQNREMIGKDGAFRAVPARVMRHGNQIRAVPVAALERDRVQGADRSRQIKVAATETGGDLLAARVNAGGFRFGEHNAAAMVFPRAGTGFGWRRLKSGSLPDSTSHGLEPCASFAFSHQPAGVPA
jgi:hypothetical protein